MRGGTVKAGSALHGLVRELAQDWHAEILMPRAVNIHARLSPIVKTWRTNAASLSAVSLHLPDGFQGRGAAGMWAAAGGVGGLQVGQGGRLRGRGEALSATGFRQQEVEAV